jgi:galactonate dehydratase
MALWDIKGKALGRPVYDLLGGPMRDKVLLYSHVSPTNDIPKAVADAKRQVALGYSALKLDPFGKEMGPKHRRYIDGKISAAGAAFGEDLMAALREAVGPDVELMIDAHGNFDVPTAIELCNRMKPYNLTWFEEPTQPESIDALRQVRANTDIPLCTGERKYTRWDFVPILTEGLVNFIMPDICWTGGISEMRKIAILAESFYVPVSPHDASGPFNVLTGAHTMITVPNFYRLEMTDHAVNYYNNVLTEPLDIRDGYIHLPDRPGLGYELNHDFIKANPDPDWQRIKGS